MVTAWREAPRLISPMTGRQGAIFQRVYMAAGWLPDSQKNQPLWVVKLTRYLYIDDTLKRFMGIYRCRYASLQIHICI